MDLDLAVSATLGGGLFILCVVFAAVVLAAARRGDCPEIPVRVFVGVRGCFLGV